MNGQPSHDRSRDLAVILAGGAGTRLQEFSYTVSGDRRPKQFSTFFGGKSLLAHTRERISPLFDEENTLFALTRAHEIHYQRQLTELAADRKLVQPLNRGTAPAIALSVLEILHRESDATVAFFPSDHHYLDPTVFRATVSRGLILAKEFPDRILIVGAPATYPEVEYGWIQPGLVAVDSPQNPLHFVSAFWEKPSLPQARSLQQAGCLWNTFVTIGSASAFVELFARAAPRLLQIMGSGFFEDRLERVYQEIEPMDFSRDVLALVPHRLLVLRDGASGWTDFGSPQRALDVLHALAC
ncbi:MAG TPA: sugar phosphate nucleotidyltransferase [Bryobacteraceae bacterium]